MLNESSNLQFGKFYSKKLEKEMEYMIYLPRYYSPLYTYPLIIVQDGQDYIKFGRLIKVVENFIEQGMMDDCIIALLPYASVTSRWENYHPKGKNHTAYQHFIIDEWIPFLSQNYPIQPMASGRTLIGDSLGGTLSLIIAMNYPHSIGQVIMQSPFVNADIIEAMNAFTQVEQLSIYHCIGKKETVVKTTWGDFADFLTPNRELNEVMQNKPFAFYEYKELNGDHNWKSWQPNLPDALLAIFDN